MANHSTVGPGGWIEGAEDSRREENLTIGLSLGEDSGRRRRDAAAREEQHMKKVDIHIHPQKDDLELDQYLQAMDRFEVEAALVHGAYHEWTTNDRVLRICRAHPDRFYGSCYVDLLQPLEACIEVIRRYAGEGFRCFKVFPNFGFDPNDERFEPFWQAVEDAKLMCLPHCGWLLLEKPETRRKQSITASPFHFETPARLHPGINFVFAHFGGGATYLETVVLLSRLANCYADTTPGWGRWVFEQRLPALSAVDFSRVLYGTDNAGEQYGEQERRWVELLSSMGRSRAEIEQYFYGNAARLLGLAAQPASA